MIVNLERKKVCKILNVQCAWYTFNFLSLKFYFYIAETFLCIFIVVVVVGGGVLRFQCKINEQSSNTLSVTDRHRWHHTHTTFYTHTEYVLCMYNSIAKMPYSEKKLWIIQLAHKIHAHTGAHARMNSYIIRDQTKNTHRISRLDYSFTRFWWNISILLNSECVILNFDWMHNKRHEMVRDFMCTYIYYFRPLSPSPPHTLCVCASAFLPPLLFSILYAYASGFNSGVSVYAISTLHTEYF